MKYPSDIVDVGIKYFIVVYSDKILYALAIDSLADAKMGRFSDRSHLNPKPLHDSEKITLL